MIVSDGEFVDCDTVVVGCLYFSMINSEAIKYCLSEI
jgi:hypothetical protein